MLQIHREAEGALSGLGNGVICSPRLTLIPGVAQADLRKITTLQAKPPGRAVLSIY
jgi:hypothetical protein